MPVDMARNDAENDRQSLLEGPAEERKYPYGLLLNLEEPEVQKLGLESPTVGASIEMEITVRVDSISSNENGRSLGLQVTAMGLKEETGPGDRETILYGGE